MSHSSIHIEGARQHNLKNLSLDIPRDELVVVCGPSGSGKSTLAFDIVYAEGQRRYVESLSAYARQFLPQMDKPDVDKIEGLSPAISLEQQTTGRNPRSTVGTVTEVYDFLRVFFARLGKMYCPQCGRPIEARAADEIIADILALPEGTKVIIMAPLVELQKGTHLDRFKKLKAEGFVRVRVDGQLYGMEDIPALDKNKKHTIDLVIDRLVIKDGIRGRLADSVELALRYGEGRIIVNEPDKGADGDTLHATESVCPVCKISLPAPSPQLFSFNSPQGACPRCAGLGTVEYFEPMLIAPNRGLSLNTKAILPWANPKTFARYEEALTALGKRFGFTLSTPLSAYSPEALQALFYGEDDPSQKSKSGLRRNRLGGSVALESPEYDDNAPAPVKAYDGPYKLATDNWPGVIPLLERGMQYGDMWRDSAVPLPPEHGLPHMPRRAPAARIAGRARGRSQHPPVLLPARGTRSPLAERAGVRRAPRPRRRAAPQRTESPAVVHDQCGPRLHLVGPHHDHALRRGIAAHPPRLAARFRAGGRNLRARRAVHRPASPGQRTPHCHAPQPSGARQHGAGGRARRSHHPRGRPHHRAWARFRRARRRHGVPRLFREPDQALGDADRQVHAGGFCPYPSPTNAANPRAGSPCAGSRPTTSRISTVPFRSAR